MATKPILVGIAGDSAAGRTFLVDGIVRLLDQSQVTVVCTNDYHRYDRAERARRGLTPLDPACQRMDVMVQQLRRLAAGRPVMKPVYDHATGTFGALDHVVPKAFVIVEGLHVFSAPALRDCFALKVFVAPPESLRRQWKVERDTRERGYTLAQALAELERRELDSARFIHPQYELADLRLRFEPAGNVFEEAADPLRVCVGMRPTISHDDLVDVVTRVADGATSRTDLSLEQARRVHDWLWARMQPDRGLRPEDIGNFVEGGRRCHSEMLALAQLVIASYLGGVRKRGQTTFGSDNFCDADGR